MKTKFSPSINIERDIKNEQEYFVTPNAQLIFSELEQSIRKGIHSFELIGSFGTGKSSFLLALQKHLEGKKKTFSSESKFSKKNKFITITGYYNSISNLFLEKINNKNSNNFLELIEKEYTKNKKAGFNTFIFIDEFGKVLEYSARNNPEKELSDIQRLAELVNDHSKNLYLITTLHQGFDTYSSELNNRQRDEWTKVKGRFKSLLFNEPVEQLLYLAAEKINNGKQEVDNLEELLNTIKSSGTYSLKLINKKIAKKLFPFDILAISSLTIALQKYGQNERSLFTFLNSEIAEKLHSSKRFLNIVDIYDYLISNLHHFLTSKYNPDFVQWQSIINSLQRIYEFTDSNIEIYISIIKTIGLLKILSGKGAKINNDFIKKYLGITYSYKEIDKYIEILEKQKIIRFQKFNDSFILFEGTDLDIDFLIKSAEDKIVKPENITSYLKQYFNLNPVSAKAHYYKTGTPRYFEFQITDKEASNKRTNSIDGYVNIILKDYSKLKESELHKIHSRNTLYVYIKKPEILFEHIIEIEKIKYVFENDLGNDRVAEKELSLILEYHINELNMFLSQYLFSKNENIAWYYLGEKIEIYNKSDFNKWISKICDKIYHASPTLNNELINRSVLPGNISRARRLLVEAILKNWESEDLNFSKSKFPPEKTIYLSLLKDTGIHKESNNNFGFFPPNEKSFYDLWAAMEKFLEESVIHKKSIQSLIEILEAEPFGLKLGFIDVWLSVWLIIKRDDFAFYNNDTFVPSLSKETIDLVLRKPGEYFIKSFDLGGIKYEFFNKYREFINTNQDEAIDKQSFIETIKPFLILYKSLPHYTQKTNRLSIESINLREAIINARDPETFFFDTLPNALGYTTAIFSNDQKKVEEYFKTLKQNIEELQKCFTNLLDRIEKSIIEEFHFDSQTFNEYKDKFQSRYNSIKQFVLLPKQKIILQRINSKLDERDTWLNSFVQSISGKQLAMFEDDDEEKFYLKLNKMKKEFDNLCEFANLNIDNQKEDAVKVEITTMNEGTKQKVFTLLKSGNEASLKSKEKINSLLEKVPQEERLKILYSLLKEELDG